MGRSNLIPITRIYDIYPKYTYSDDVKKFMDEIVDIDRANVYTEDEVVAMLTDTKDELKHCEINGLWKVGYKEGFNDGVAISVKAVQQKINELKENK
jgi:hypothetical protein